MYLKQVFNFQHEFWRYVIGSILVILVNVAGQVPFVVALIMKEGLGFETLDPSSMLSALDPNLTLFLLMFPFLVSLIALYFIVKYFHKQSFTSLTTARSKTDWKRIFFAFSLWAVITAALTIVDYTASPEDYEINFRLWPFIGLFIIAIIFVPIQTSLEEYVFRGYLMQGLGALTKNKWMPLIFTSLIFGGLHFFNPEVDKLGNIIMVYYIGTGLFLGIITLMDDGMELALGFHAANNLITALLVTADWTAFQTNSVLKDTSDPSAGFDVLVPVLIVYPILLGVFAYKYKWNNWKEKLFGKVLPPENTGVSESI